MSPAHTHTHTYTHMHTHTHTHTHTLTLTLTHSHIQCSYFISEYEDDLVDMFQDDIPQEEMVQELCYEITGMLHCAHFTPHPLQMLSSEVFWPL